MIPRPRQKEMGDACLKAAAESKTFSTLAVAPTGSGKTVILSYILGHFEVALVLQHREELVDQNIRTFKAVNPRKQADVFKANRKRFLGVGATFAMVQTLVRNLDRMKRVDVIGIDEGHHAVAESYQKIIDKARELNPNVKIIGVTATPSRSDRKALATIFDNVADVIQLAELIQAGHLVRPRTFVIDCGLREELSQVRKTVNDFDMSEVEKIMDKMAVNDRVFEEWQGLAGNRSTVIFCSTVAHAEHVFNHFKERGVTAEFIHGNLGVKERRAAFDRFDRAISQVLVNVAVATEGWDCLDSETEILSTEGWKGIGEISIGEKIYAYNSNKKTAEITYVTDARIRTVRKSERMLSIESQHVNIRVTENHRMLASFSRKENERFILAKDLFLSNAEYALPISAEFSFPGIPLSDDEIRLIAWYATDGYLSDLGRLQIYQTKHKHSGHISFLLEKMGLKFSVCTIDKPNRGFGNARPMDCFSIGKKQIGKLIPFLTKDFSGPVRNMSRDQFEIFWNELLLGDGEGERCLCIGKKIAADNLNSMAVVRGFSSSVSERKRDRLSYRVFVNKKQRINSLPSDPRSARRNLEESHPQERVWCVTNPLETLFIRRRGKVAIVGNCQHVSCVILLRPCSHKSTVLQMIGRGLRKVDPERYPWALKDDCIVIDFGYSLITHGSLDVEIELEPQKRQPKRINCPFCEAEIPPTVTNCPLCDGLINDRAAVVRSARERGALEEFKLTEIEIIDVSPFKWEDMFENLVLMADAMTAWACIVLVHGRWHAVGWREGAAIVNLANSEDRVMALGSADDFLREHGDTENARKSRSWMALPPTDKQLEILQLPAMAAMSTTRYRAACLLTWKSNEKIIRKKVLPEPTKM